MMNDGEDGKQQSTLDIVMEENRQLREDMMVMRAQMQSLMSLSQTGTPPTLSRNTTTLTPSLVDPRRPHR